MNKPNGLMVNLEARDNKRYNVFYLRNEDGSYEEVAQEYKQTTDVANLDPIVNWLTWIPNKEWIHPVSGVFANGGLIVKAIGEYHESEWKGKSMPVDDMYLGGVLFKKFDEILDSYTKENSETQIDNLIAVDFKNK